MKYSALAGRLPAFLHRYVLYFESAIESAVADFAASLPHGARVLDAGAGECRHASLFREQQYCGIDLAIGDASWNYGKLDALADLTALPFRDASFQACLSIVTLEHVCEPRCALEEIARTLSRGGRLLLIVPHEWEIHQAPHDYYRYTRHGIAYLCARAGFSDLQIVPVGGYFRLLARRLLNGLQFFSGGLRWIWFLPAAVLLVPPALLLPQLDFLDSGCNFTLGYICTATKRS